MTEKVPLNAAQTVDLWQLFHQIPYLLVSRNAFVSMVLHCPPKIVLKSFGTSVAMSQELDILFDLYWRQWCIDVYDWLQIYGVVPWYFEKVRGSDHWIPVVPKVGSGIISTYLDKEHRQQYEYAWIGGDVDNRFYFETKSHAPMINGNYASPIASLLPEWRTTRIVRESTEMASYHQARTQHVFEFHPPKNVVGDTSLTTLQDFGDTIAATVVAQQEQLYGMKLTVKTDQLRDSLSAAAAANRAARSKFGSVPLHSESPNRRYDRENANILETGAPLPPDYVYKAVPAPQVTAKLGEFTTRLDHMASAVMDIPISVIEASSQSKTTAGVQSNFRILNERIKDWQTFFRKLVKKAFLLGYGAQLNDEFRRRVYHRHQHPNTLLELFADTEVEVEMPCTPIGMATDFDWLHRMGYMLKETAGTHIFNTYGIPVSDMHLTKKPDLLVEGQEPQKKKAKTAVQL